MTCKDCGWKSVNPSGAIFCGYTDLRTWEDESCGAWKPARVGVTPYTEEDWKRTNADRVRNMDDYNLAIFLENVSCKHADTESWLDWLKREVE